jgi:hypothetical protein
MVSDLARVYMIESIMIADKNQKHFSGWIVRRTRATSRRHTVRYVSYVLSSETAVPSYTMY